MRQIDDGVHLFGPQAVPFWPGNFAAFRERFMEVAAAIEDQSSPAWRDAQRLISQIPTDRATFQAIPEDEKTAWLVNMPVVELSPKGTGLLVYSPLPMDGTGRLKAALDALGPVRVIVAPSGAHTLGLPSFRVAYPEALFLCPQGGGALGRNLEKNMPEIGFHRALASTTDFATDPTLAPLLARDFELEVTRDNAGFEIMLLHRPSGTALTSDTVYKTDLEGGGPGPGGPENQYLAPSWFASAYQALALDPSPNRVLPDYRVIRVRLPGFDADGMRASLRRVLSWDIDCLLCCHTDPIPGTRAKQVILDSWAWLLEEGA